MPEEAEEVAYTPPAFTPVAFSRSESLKFIAPALVKAQKNLKNPPKDSKNPHFGNNFAGLGVTMDAARDALNAEGIAILTPPTPAPEGYIGVSVILLHQSGEFIEGRGYIPLERSNAQGAGSAITYARRYYVQSTMGFVGEDDDDGEAASRGNVAREERPVQPAKRRSSLFGNK